MKKIIILLAMMSLFLVWSASATIECNATFPTVISLNTVINASLNGSESGWDSVYTAWYLKSASTANSSWSLVGNHTNASNTANNMNMTFGIEIILEDSNDYQGNVTCYGEGGGDNVTSSSITTGITVDRSKPTLPSALAPSGTQSNTTLDIVATIVGVNTTTCTLKFIGSSPKGASFSNAMTHSGDLCTKSYSSVSDLSYQYQIIACDGTNCTVWTDSTFITVDAEDANLQGLGAVKIAEQKAQQKRDYTWLIIVAFVVIVLVATKKK